MPQCKTLKITDQQQQQIYQLCSFSIEFYIIMKKSFLHLNCPLQVVIFMRKCLNFSPATFLNKRLWHRCFPVNLVKFLRTSFYRTPLVAAPGNQTEIFLIFLLTFISLFSLIVYLVRFNTNNKRHFLTYMLTRVSISTFFIL